MGRPLVNFKDRTFGRLKATDQIKRYGRQASERLCICDCGKEVWVRTDSLSRGETISCGCYREEIRKLPSGLAARNEVLSYYKRSAKARNLTWCLIDKEFDLLILSRCFYCNREPFNIRFTRADNGHLKYNGIDRLNNDIGYTIDNAVSCCKICNRAKRDMSLSDFMEWIKNISEYYESKKFHGIN